MTIDDLIDRSSHELKILEQEYNKTYLEYLKNKKSHLKYAHLKHKCKELAVSIENEKVRLKILKKNYEDNLNNKININRTKSLDNLTEITIINSDDENRDSDIDDSFGELNKEYKNKTMALKATEVEDIVKAVFPNTFSGEQNEIPQLLNILKYLKERISHIDNQVLLVLLIKMKLKGVVLTICNDANSIDNVITKVTSLQKHEKPEDILAKLKNLTIQSKDKTIKDIEELSKKLKAAYIEREFSSEQAEYLTVNAARDTYMKAVGSNPVNQLAIRNPALVSVEQIAAEYAAIETAKATTKVLTASRGRGNYRGRGRGYSRGRGGRGGNSTQTSQQNQRSNDSQGKKPNTRVVTVNENSEN